ncbi:MAG TPA: alpha-L-arabinofuranosidase C-terminal domain-containing protein [Anaerolineae bacterium]|nr:alpha-L-arabinofuranosidase C-terminal domain-containing protein [Anaerolineae bacterium]
MKKSLQEATIRIDTGRIIGDIDPKIYGVFMEPIGFNRNGVTSNTLYGPVYNPDSPLANAEGFNTEYIKAAQELRISNMRWPGGNFTANYHWQDGIGPKDQRPVRKELAWGVNESNQVGTDEWVQLNSAIHSENVVCLNMGTGGIQDACSWLEYCNGEPGSYYADLRAKFGHPDLYGIKYWCLGNEVDGSPWIIGHKNVDEYCRLAKEIAKAMKKVDPTITLIANGSSYYQPTMDWVEWNWKVLNELRGVADYLSLHRYWDHSDNYYEYMGKEAMVLEEKIAIPAAQAQAVQKVYRMAKPMYLSFDEWAPHPHSGGLLTTLAAAQFLNAFIRHADMVKMANYTLLTAILGFDPTHGKHFKTPFFYVFKMFSNACLGKSLDAWVSCDTFDVDAFYKAIPYLDVSTVYAEDSHTLILNVVNRHQDKAVTADIISSSGDFASEARAQEVYREDLKAPYTYAEQDEYIPKTNTVATDKSTLTHVFPPHSFTQITVGMNE